MAAAGASPPTPWVIFSYGSNSTKQLQARVANINLTSVPAVLIDHARCFCFASNGWGGGGVASICPAPGEKTFGALVRLTEEEKMLLDTFEGGYRLESVQVLVGQPPGTPTNAMAYIAGFRATEQAPFTHAMSAEPSEQYLCAIHCQLREHWDMQGETLTIRSFDDGQAKVIRDWRHPGVKNLESLEGLAVEVNIRRTEPWEMPRTANRIREKLNKIGIHTVGELAAALAPNQQPELNQRLTAANESQLASVTLKIIRELLL